MPPTDPVPTAALIVGRGNWEDFGTAKRRDEQALGIAARVDGVGEAIDVVLSYGAVSDTDANAAWTPERPRLEQ